MIPIGDRLNDKYRVTRKLGGGGFGEVFLAEDDLIRGRQVAIKVLRRSREGDHSDLVWEMTTLSKFHHPHVVAFHEYFVDGGRLHLVMEFCPGGSLDDRLKSTGSFSMDQAFAWGVDLCETLAFVHGKGIVHHDIKPQNILFEADGTIKLGDFGIANRSVGTRLYMPPEMLFGERVSRTDPRIDVYALGLTLLETVTGHHPFEALGAAESVQARIEHGFVPPNLPRWVQEVLLKATHPTPELRFQTARDFAEAINARHVPYVFDGKRIKADALARKAEAAIERKKWRTAERLTSFALEQSPDCVAALVAAGRCDLLLRRLERAKEHLSRAVAINPRALVQKELGWINLEQGRLPTAISMLTDHLQRNASDYEAYSLLLKCFYMSDRFEAGRDLARTLLKERVPNDSFRSNLFVCQLLSGLREERGSERVTRRENPFIAYNAMIAAERPSSWAEHGAPSMKSKLLFQEYRFGGAAGTVNRNRLVVYTADGVRHDFVCPIVAIGSLASNDVVLGDMSVSRRHCVIANYADDVWLYDLGSTVGTAVDGQRVGGRVFLDGVHEVLVGKTCIRVASSHDRLI